MKALYLIPARGGSKGIPHKNIKLFNGKPLIYYAIDVARHFVSDDDICVSTDDDDIIKVVEEYGLKVAFKRPGHLAADISGSYGVMLHALDFFAKRECNYDTLVLLQPTSPFRRAEDVASCLQQYERGGFDMVVSVTEAATNPYYNCHIPWQNNYLKPFIDNVDVERRQDAPKVYEYNGACYVIDTKSLMQKPLRDFENIGFVNMDRLHSIDLDTMFDWKFAEFVSKEGLV